MDLDEAMVARCRRAAGAMGTCWMLHRRRGANPAYGMVLSLFRTCDAGPQRGGRSVPMDAAMKRIDGHEVGKLESIEQFWASSSRRRIVLFVVLSPPRRTASWRSRRRNTWRRRHSSSTTTNLASRSPGSGRKRGGSRGAQQQTNVKLVQLATWPRGPWSAGPGG